MACWMKSRYGNDRSHIPYHRCDMNLFLEGCRVSNFGENRFALPERTFFHCGNRSDPSQSFDLACHNSALSFVVLWDCTLSGSGIGSVDALLSSFGKGAQGPI